MRIVSGLSERDDMSRGDDGWVLMMIYDDIRYMVAFSFIIYLASGVFHIPRQRERGV